LVFDIPILMKKLILLFFLASPVFLRAADAAQAETGKSKPLRSYHDFLAAIPKDMEPWDARNWTAAQKEVANGILKKKLVDAKRPVRMRFKVHGVDFWGRFVLWSHLPADEGYAIRIFASQWREADMLPKLAALRKGDLIEMTGLCDLAKFENLWNTDSLSLGIGNAAFIKLQPDGSPAPGPERVPVKLVSAVYGSGTQFTDVTGRVKALLDEPGAVFHPNPHWLGADPTPGWNKALVIVHENRGVRSVFTTGENGEVSAALVVK